MSSTSSTSAISSRWSLGSLGDRQTWIEFLVGCLLFAGAGGIWWHRGQMSLPKQVALWALLLVATAVLLRRGWLQLFGPVLFYDLVRLGRRGRFFLLRCLYALLLLLILYYTYERFLESMSRVLMFAGGGWYYQPRGTLKNSDLSKLAEAFFFAFMFVQFLAVFILTPGYTAGAIAEEKDRKTLEFLLATDLQSREIVLSKLLARVANLTLLILTGLPILSLTQFLGGVDPNMLAAGFAATALSMFSLASLSILTSVLVRKPRDAILLTYLFTGGYLGLSSLLGAWAGAPAFLSFVNSGNLLLAIQELRDAVGAGIDLATVIPNLLRNYFFFHGTIAIVCMTLAVVRLRPVALRQTARPRAFRTVGRWGRPRVGKLPMIWKEVFIEPGFRLNWVGWAIAWVMIFLSLAPAVYLIGDNLLQMVTSSALTTGMARDINLWARVTTTCILCLMLVGVAVRAAGSVSGERDRETMDGLLTSPLQSHDILFAKWLGSFLSVRWTWWWLVLIWLIALATNGLHPLAIPMQMSAWVVYAGALAGLGLWFSTSCPTTMRATMWTLSITGGLCAFHWVAWMFCCPGGVTFSFGLQSTITPPFILYWLGVGPQEMSQMEWDMGFVLAMFGLMGWALVAAFLWSITSSRFRRTTARMPHRRPTMYDMPASAYGRKLGQKY